ncbi:MAG TPA: zinc ribbon domain-containing protein [Thermoplasmata archaeon]|nr:zinc ribbon domain-containing protein [Thermoplasmata archaeon]
MTVTLRLLRAATYVPRTELDGVRVAGPDEDAFTLGATALERLLAPPGDRAPAALHLVGAFPPIAGAGYPLLLGRPVPVVAHGDGPEAVDAAFAASSPAGADGATAVVLVVDEPDRADDGLAAGPAVAVAVEVAADGAGGPPPAGDDRSTGARARRWAAAASDPAPVPVEDARPIPIDRPRLRAAAAVPVGAVSEGAYVPRPRYLESVPSRWRLVAERCSACGALTFPARGACRWCGNRDGLGAERLPADGGTVVASTVIGAGSQPTEFDGPARALGPYGVVLVELAPGARGTFLVTDAPGPKLPIGSRVGTRLRRLYPMEGEWRYGRKAVPLPVDEAAGRSAGAGSHGAPSHPS